MRTVETLSHYDKIAAGRGLARRRLPYFSAALFALMPRPMPGMFLSVGAAMAVTPRGIMYYDPQVVENEWTLADVEFGLLHEIGHLLRGHSHRCEVSMYDKRIWNIACDAAINDDLVAAGCRPLHSDVLPEKITCPDTQAPMASGLPEETYYAALQKVQQANTPKSGESTTEGKDGASSMGKARPGNGACGGVAGNPLQGLVDDGVHSEVDQGRTDAALQQLKKAVARDIQKYQSDKGAGSVPGSWSTWAGGVLTPPKVRWQDKLRRAMTSSVTRAQGCTDYHYERPSRRQWAVGYAKGAPVLPSMYSTTPSIAVFVDTSGSAVPDHAAAVSEVNGILKLNECHVLFSAFDSDVKGLAPVRSIDDVTKRLVGGGGTDFTPIFNSVMGIAKSVRPKLVVIITDGFGPAPETPPPGLSVIWVLTGKGARVPYTSGAKQISWGTHIFISGD